MRIAALAGTALLLLAAKAQAQCPAVLLWGSAGSTGDGLGQSVRADGQRVITGAYLDDPLGVDSGSAYVFRETPPGWNEEGYLAPGDGQPNDQFGTAVDISGEVAVVGAWRRSSDRGTAYVFRFDGIKWVEEARLDPAAGAAGDRIGESVAIDGDVIVLGAAGTEGPCPSASGPDLGAAYVYRYDGANWVEEAMLKNPICRGSAQFGISVSISGDVILVGAWHDRTPSGPLESGTATFFRYDGATWEAEQQVWAHDGEREDWFGWASAIHNDAAVITSRQDDDLGANSGSAYVYQYDATAQQWQFEQKLVSPDAGVGGAMGFSAAIRENLILLGAPTSDFAETNAGAVIPFRRESTGNWVQSGPLAADPAVSRDYFGNSVDLFGSRAVVGAPSRDHRRVDDGLAFVIETQCGCRADLTGDGILDFFDFLEFQNLFAAGDLRADFDGSGQLDFFDFLAFQNEFAAGCP